MKKYLVASLVIGCFFETVYACGGIDDVTIPLLYSTTHDIILIVAAGALLSSFIVKDLRQYRFRWVVVLVAAVVFLFELFIMSDGILFDQCIDARNMDVKNIVIPELDFSTTTRATTSQRRF